MKIEKKVWTEYFEDIKSGKKNFELRLADFECKPGDILVLREWDPKTENYTEEILEKEVGYVIKTKDCPSWSQEEVDKFGYQVIGFK